MITWLSKVSSSGVLAAGLAAAAVLTPSTLLAQPELLTEEGVIAGTMDITFNTRTSKDSSGDLKEGSAALGAKDAYKFTLNVAKTTQFSGTITRQPNLFSKIISSKKQSAQLFYDVSIALFNPKDLKQKVDVGKWVGTVPIDDKSGAYELAGGKASESPLKFAIDTRGKASGFQDLFAGRLVGRSEKKQSLVDATYKRLIGDKTVEIKKKVDPMRFEGIELARGPSDNYPRTKVNGRLDFDYETGNYFTDGIRFTYSVDGKDFEDVVTGTIKFVEDADRKTNGKGYYAFNLRFNEEKNKSTGSEAAAFEKMSAEDAFFAVDNSIPCLEGRVTYVDAFVPGGDVPASSKITYALNANKLSKQQIMNFFKLWMVAIGPTNDEVKLHPYG